MKQGNFSEQYAKGDEPVVLKASNALRGVVEFVGRWGAWFIVPLVLVTVLDVVARKLTFRMADGSVYGLQIWLKTYISRYFESTLLQELEWHLHTALFALVLGFGTIYNTHVRVDLVRDHVSFRKKIWIEFLGLSCFMIPYLLLVIYFAWSLGRRLLSRRRNLGVDGGPEPPLDHQGGAGGGPDYRNASRHRSLASGGAAHLERSAEALSVDDTGMARGGRLQDRGQGAHQA